VNEKTFNYNESSKDFTLKFYAKPLIRQGLIKIAANGEQALKKQ
jgi:hypothetical protein